VRAVMLAAAIAQRLRLLVAEEGVEAGIARFSSGAVEGAFSKECSRVG
jgi:hypothetical protein